MTEQDQRPESGANGAIDRLDVALGRIAAAAGRRQDALRVAELTVRAAQHETDLLLQAEIQSREASASVASEVASTRVDQMRALAAQLDGLIAKVRAEIEEPPARD